MRRGGAALAAAIMLWSLTACGGDDQTTGIATLGGDSTATTDEQAGPAEEQDLEEQALEFAECMRDNGVDMPDPQVEGGRMLFGGGAGGEVDPEIQEQAMEACEDKRPDGGGNFSPEDQAEMQDRMLAMAECMRENGYDMPDPDFSGGGGGFVIGPESGLDLDDPDFQAAMEACRDEVGMPAPQGSRDEQGAEG